MLSAHGSAPEVVAAARDEGRFVVDAVCPLVTKVHHEAKVARGQGLHHPLRGTPRPRRGIGHARRGARRDPTGGGRRRPRARAPHRRRPVEGRSARADHPLHARLGGDHGPRPGRVPRSVDRGTRRPLLRHHEPSGGAAGHRGRGRRDRGDRQRELVEHARARQGRAGGGLPGGVARRRAGGDRRRRPRRREGRGRHCRHEPRRKTSCRR